jgi:hypothetical protein
MFEKMQHCKNISEASQIEVDGKKYSRFVWSKVMKNRGEVNVKKKGKKSVWSDSQVDTICDYIEKNNDKSLSEILDYAVKNLQYPSIALSSFERYLDLKLITWKQTIMHPMSRNSEETKEKRKDYALWLSKNMNKRKIYLDGFFKYDFIFYFNL